MQKIRLYEKEIYDGALEVTLQTMLHAASPEITKGARPAMIVFPGGGYWFTSDREAEPIASAYFAEGYNCFILRYTVGERAKIDHPLYDAAAAVAYVRTHAAEYNIDPHRIAVIGFSAGGHLAGYIATCWHRSDISEILGMESTLFRPDAAILGYPVVTNNVPTHDGSFNALLGDNRTPELNARANLDMHVDECTCPCFIWHTAADTSVPVANSLAFARALTDKGIGCELHIFPMGEHGLSRANAETAPDWANRPEGNPYNIPYVARWVEWSFKWLEQVFYGGNYSINI